MTPRPDLGPQWEWFGLLSLLATVVSLASAALRADGTTLSRALVEALTAGLLLPGLLALILRVHALPPAFEAGFAMAVGYLGPRVMFAEIRRRIGMGPGEPPTQRPG